MKTIKAKNWLDKPKNFSGIVIDNNGDKAWFQNGQYHRIDGPAVEFKDGTKWWWQNGILHRIDGPAVEYPDGNKSYFVLSQKLTENQFQIFQVMWENSTYERTDELMKIFLKLVRIQK